MEALALAGAAIERIQMLALVFARTGLRRQLEPSLDHIGHVHENRRRALLAILINKQKQIADVAGVHRLANGRSGCLVSTSLRRTDWKRIGFRT